MAQTSLHNLDRSARVSREFYQLAQYIAKELDITPLSVDQ